MIYNSDPNHIEINIDETAHQMGAMLHGSSVVSAFPKGPFATLPLVVLLTGPARNKLYRFRDHFVASAIKYEKVDMVRNHHVVQNTQPVAFFCLKQPV
jgi:hypothetical protein